jgi:hypothetical protein
MKTAAYLSGTTVLTSGAPMSDHKHEYELLHKDRYIAVFFCDCGASRSAPVDEQGRIHFWTSATEPRQLEDGPHGSDGH